MGGEVSKEKLLNYDDKERLIPTHFYAAIDKKLYGFGIPVAHEMLKNLQDHYNVGLIITLLLQPLHGGRMINHQPIGSEQFDNPEYCDTDKHLTEGLNIKFVHIPIQDGYAPKVEEMKQFIQLVKDTNANGKAVGVHCWQGIGRTGTMLCGYLMSQGFRAQDAMNMLGIRSGKHIKSSYQVKYLTNPKFPENAAHKDYPENKIATPAKAPCSTHPVKEHTQSIPIPIRMESPRAISMEYSKSPSPHTNSFITSTIRRPSVSSYDGKGTPKTPVGTPKNLLDSVR